MSYLRIAIQKIIYQLFILLLIYAIFRWLFYAFNISALPSVQSDQVMELIFGGARFDISAILYTNLLWALLTVFISLTSKSKTLKTILGISFYVPNILAFLFEISDWMYFNFNRKRSTFDIFDILFSKGDFLNLLPSYLAKYWFVPLIGLAFILLLIASHRWLNRRFLQRALLFEQLGFPKIKGYYFGVKFIVVLFIIGLSIIGMRGGLQLKPILPNNAVEYAQVEQAALVLNTPFSIITTIQGDRLKPVQFLTDQKADEIIKPIKQYHQNTTLKKKNIVFIIWESLSKRYTVLGSENKTCTPFLDSLISKSHVFTNAYANALRSNDGLPAIFSGIPAMMEGSVINSIYSNNSFTSIPELLAKEGYQTSFFHGGTNGTLNLDTYTKSAGFQHYFGRKEYNNEKDYDGAWGIWDKPFLQFFLSKISETQRPFCTSVFTLSSHMPFKVPQDFVASTNGLNDEVERSMNYTDQALAAFFQNAKAQDWYENTLFVITGDHACPISDEQFYVDGLGRYQIPILIFDPSQEIEAQRDSSLFQQIDILPTLIDYLNYDKPFFALGNSALDTILPRFWFSYLSGNYSFIRNGYHFKTRGYQVDAVYKFPEDSADKSNLFQTIRNSPEFIEADNYNKSFIQLLNNGMLNDQLTVKDYKHSLHKP